jgi:hypothetical protein
MLFYDAITLRDILKANGSLLKFYSVLLCDTLITIDTVGILNEMKNAEGEANE